MPKTGKPVLFIYTNSFDLSADTLIRRLGNDAVFRFNVDLWQEYAVEIDCHRVVIANPAGRRIESANIAKFLWRKPYTSQQLYPDRIFPHELVFKEEELAYAMREVWNAMPRQVVHRRETGHGFDPSPRGLSLQQHGEFRRQQAMPTSRSRV